MPNLSVLSPEAGLAAVRSLLLRLLLLLLVPAWLGTGAARAAAVEGEGDITLQSQFWVDESSRLSIDEVAGGAAKLQPMEHRRTWQLGDGALWMRFELPRLDTRTRWHLMLTGAAYFNRASLFVRGSDGRWQEQQAGDHIPVGRWHQPNFSPLFTLPGAGGDTVWLRLQNRPAPTSPFVQLLTEEKLQATRQWTYLLLGGYVGFCLLVFVVGLMHARMYADLAFDAYCAYVACMLMFQLAYTGMGGLFLWPQWAWFNDSASGLFLFPMAACGIWFVREATALRRHSRALDRVAMGFVLFGFAFTPVYVAFPAPATLAVLNVYALVSVVLSISLSLWTWRKGEKYSGWLFLGFLPIHLAYPFPALRTAGWLADSWATQYAVLIGSAIEIPLLLYILHARAKDFSENRARLRVLDTTDPLTGLTITPVLRLRLRDAMRRARRSGQRCSVLLVELANHADIVAKDGREAGDRSLVVAASRLSQVVREVDTVCRVATTRFAILLEGPQPEDSRRTVAQHLVARGLEPVPQLPADVNLRFRVVSAWVPDGSEAAPDGAIDELRVLEWMDEALNGLLDDPRKVVQHLEPRVVTTRPTPVPA